MAKNYKRKEDRGEKRSPDGDKPSKGWNRTVLVWIVIFLCVWGLYLSRVEFSQHREDLTYGRFYQLLQEGRVETATVIDDVVKVELDDGTSYNVTIVSPESDREIMPLLRAKVKPENLRVKRSRAPIIQLLLAYVAPVILLVFLFWFLFYRTGQGGNRILSFGKSRARLSTESNVRVTFSDVAGVDEAKEELTEVIQFLKDPKKFQRLGGKIPKGVLLMGDPGTGKTLLAKAVAGEAGVPFFNISGSDFVEMFVGVGASRVRDLFDRGKRYARQHGKGCIIFIDEIDAVGRQRFSGIGGGHDEREQTLNALLVEMDGFNTDTGVIVVAATNRPDVLDRALLRRGRFDRQIVVSRPDIKGREDILKVHAKDVKLSPDVDLGGIARKTPGFSGADLANLVNEAALLASRENKPSVAMRDLEVSIERVMAGPERKSRVISDYEKRMVAYHESGHALLSLLLPGPEPLHKVSIIPRGAAALGYTLRFPLEDRYLATKDELLNRLTALMGGRAAEEIAAGHITTGAHNDISIATETARSMVCEYGMSERLGAITFGRKGHEVFLGRDLMEEKGYSEQTAIIIDQEIRKIIEECHERARKLLQDNIEKLKALAERLLQKEILDAGEVRQIVNLDDAAVQADDHQAESGKHDKEHTS